MYRDSTGPVLEDVLLCDQPTYSPSENFYDFTPSLDFSSENSDLFSDLDFDYEFFSAIYGNKDDFNITENSISFDFPELDFECIDPFEIRNSDHSIDVHHSGTESLNSEEIFENLTKKESICVENKHDYSRPVEANWSLSPGREELQNPAPKRTWGEPAYCQEFGAYQCPVEECGKLYAKASHVRAHLRRHSGEKPYRCTWAGCTWRFARSDELARHRRSHSGDKPYECRECSKRFARSDHLAKHGRVHAKRRLQAAAAATRRPVAALTHRRRLA